MGETVLMLVDKRYDPTSIQKLCVGVPALFDGSVTVREGYAHAPAPTGWLHVKSETSPVLTLARQ